MAWTVVTANLNGIRSAARKGFFDWMLALSPDVVCVQETKAQMATLLDEGLRPEGYHAFFSDAVKKGYSGTGIFSKFEPDKVVPALGWGPSDDEGRYVAIDVQGVRVASLYLPSGSSGDHRQAVKDAFMDWFYDHVLALEHERPTILAGDWNIVHRERDIKNWRANQNSSGCLPHERAWLDKCFDEAGWVDAFRVVSEANDAYTWWSYRGRARANNVGWRIDYQVITPDLKAKVIDATIVKTPMFSDHAPLVVRYDLGDGLVGP